jgi:hypothetical protein
MGVAAYFSFLQWLILLNVYMSIIFAVFIYLPNVAYNPATADVNRTATCSARYDNYVPAHGIGTVTEFFDGTVSTFYIFPLTVATVSKLMSARITLLYRVGWNTQCYSTDTTATSAALAGMTLTQFQGQGHAPVSSPCSTLQALSSPSPQASFL